MKFTQDRVLVFTQRKRHKINISKQNLDFSSITNISGRLKEIMIGSAHSTTLISEATCLRNERSVSYKERYSKISNFLEPLSAEVTTSR